MTVQELIDALAKQDPTKRATVYDDHTGELLDIKYVSTDDEKDDRAVFLRPDN